MHNLLECFTKFTVEVSLMKRKRPKKMFSVCKMAVCHLHREQLKSAPHVERVRHSRMLVENCRAQRPNTLKTFVVSTVAELHLQILNDECLGLGRF